VPVDCLAESAYFRTERLVFEREGVIDPDPAKPFWLICVKATVTWTMHLTALVKAGRWMRVQARL